MPNIVCRLNFLTLDFQASMAIAHCWKNMDTPTWIREVSDCIGLERLTYKAKAKEKYFVQLWEPYMNIMKDGNVGYI